MPTPQLTTPKHKYWREIPNKQIGNEEQKPNQLLSNQKPKLKNVSKTIVINPQWNIVYWNNIKSETIYSTAYLTGDCSHQRPLTEWAKNGNRHFTLWQEMELCSLAMDKTTTCFHTHPMADKGRYFCAVRKFGFFFRSSYHNSNPRRGFCRVIKFCMGP